MSSSSTPSTERLRTLTDRLLTRDPEAHAEAVSALGATGDERVVPHLFEVLVIDAIGSNWEEFGFPAVLRDRDPPRYLTLPEARWPGVRDALASIADPDFDSAHAWVEWETWYSQQDIEPLEGFDEWKRRLYRSYLPPVGSLLDCEPRDFDLQAIRWGNCDRSFLAALNAPSFAPGTAVDADGTGGEHDRYLEADHRVFGFEIDGTAYAVPRWVLFPHELMNVELGGVPVSLTYCTLCDAPILYDRRVGGDTLTFGSTGLLLSGNKVMYDEETESLWEQHTGAPIGGRYRERDPDLVLDQFAVTQTRWADWRAEYPETWALDIETGYDYDYSYYDGNVGFFEHYWNREDVVQPGVRKEEDRLPEKASVYGITGEGADEAWVVPADELSADEVRVGTVDGQRVAAVRDGTGDVAVYAAPPTPVERTEAGLVDAAGVEWTIERDALRAGEETRARLPGRHGLWFAFRTHYETVHVV